MTQAILRRRLLQRAKIDIASAVDEEARESYVVGGNGVEGLLDRLGIGNVTNVGGNVWVAGRAIKFIENRGNSILLKGRVEQGEFGALGEEELANGTADAA